MKNFCFNLGSKVEKTKIENIINFEDFKKKNFFEVLNFFCLVQQISLDDLSKYYIFGVKFKDFYIKVIKIF